MADPRPPARAPHYFDSETFGWSQPVCARILVGRLAGLVTPPLDFEGNTTGHIWCAYKDETSARLAFTSARGDGHVQLSVDASDWVRAEVFVSGVFVIRAWIEEAYEQKEFWPDGSDGEPDAKGDAPGRISKRGSWLQIRCADFPGTEPNEYGHWDAQIPDLDVIEVGAGPAPD